MAKLTAKQIKEQTKKIEEAIAKHKRESQGKDECFAALTPEQIEAKLKRVNSPIFVSAGWTTNLPPGSTFNYNVTVHNPDPVAADHLYVHVWVGSGNADPTVGTFLLNIDTRFPRLTLPTTSFGLTLASGANTTLKFSLPTPSTIEKTVYLGNGCLMRLDYNDAGTYLDRGSFPFRVS